MELSPLAENAGIWSVVPPLLAIVLALVTKEVIFSLFIGILAGLGIYAAQAPLPLQHFPVALVSLVRGSIGGGEHLSVLVFAFFMGPLIAVMTRAGGARAFGQWAGRAMKSALGAKLSTVFFGLAFFVDDYFNCLTIGNVMRPVTDKFLVSREKLAYFVDATAAPICVIAPITTWAVTVVGYYNDSAGGSGMKAFLQAIPFNLYSILSIVMVLWLTIRRDADYGPMASAERRARAGDPVGAAAAETREEALDPSVVSARGSVWDLAVPVVVLVGSGIGLMLWLGGYGTPAAGGGTVSMFDAIGSENAQPALSFATACLLGLVSAFVLAVPRRVITYREFFACIPAGIRMMVSALVILALAWTLSTICDSLLGIDDFISEAVRRGADAGVLPLAAIPATLFLLASVVAFSTGTSWGTFGILIPIAVAVCGKVDPSLNVLALSAILSGGVMGDHCSPISDTTILSSTGAQCRHIDHVRTQLPYALTVGAVSVVGYVVAGLTRHLSYGASAALSLAMSGALLFAALAILPRLLPARECPGAQ